MTAARKKTPKVLIADQIAEEGVELLRSNGLDTIVENAPKAARLAKLLREVDAVVVRSATKIGAASLGPRSTVKAIGRAGIGVDNIDVRAATEMGVVVLNTPDANAATTAELAIAHMFSLARKLTQADASVRGGKWEKGKFTGTEIAGKTIGVLGFGTIGRIVANRCRGLGMRVLVHDPFVAEMLIKEEGYEAVSLAQLLKQADFVTIHTPGTKATMGLIGKPELKRMKSGAYLIQCARGGIVDEQALAQALRDGQIAGAAVDVFTTEPLPNEHLLRSAPNIVFTPHLGASTAEAQRATGVAIAKQLVHFFATGEAVNAVNLPRVQADAMDFAKPYIPLARGLGKLLGELEIKNACELEVTLQGLAADLPENVIVSEVLAGLLGKTLSIPVNQVNALALAERQGIEVAVKRKHGMEEFATLIRLEARCGKRSHSLTGTLLGGAQPRIASFEGIELEAPLVGPVLLTMHKDRPGVIAKFSALLAEKRININNMHVGSNAKSKQAVALIGLNKPLPDELVATIRKFNFVDLAIHLQI